MTAETFLDEDTQAAPSAEGFLDAPVSAEKFLDEAPQPTQPDELTIREAQRATAGALQAVDVIAAPNQFNWQDVNEQLDAQRFREAEAARLQAAAAIDRGSGTGPGSEAFAWQREADFQLGNISPNTSVGRMLAQQQAGELRAITEEAGPRNLTPSEMLAGIVGPGLSATVVPIAEGAARNAGAALGGAAAAARFIPHPGANLAAQLILPMAAGLMGSQMGQAGQEMVLQATETPEETQQRQQRAAEDFAANPGLTRIGAGLSALPYFRPGIQQFAAAGAGDLGALRNLTIAGTMGAGAELAIAAARGEKAKPEDIAAAFFSGLFLNEPTRLGRRLGLTPSFEQQAMEAAQNRVVPPETSSIRREMEIFYPENPYRVRIGEVFPERIPIETGVPKPGELQSGLTTRGMVSSEDVFAGVQPRTNQPDAQQISETGTPDGGVRAPEVPPQNEGLPATEGGEGVQPGGQGRPLAETAPEAPREVTPSEVIPPEGIRYDGVTKLGEEGFYSFSDTTSIPGRTVSVTLEGTTPPTTEQIRSAIDAKIAEFQQASPENQPGATPTPQSTGEPAARGGEVVQGDMGNPISEPPVPSTPRPIPEPGDPGWATSNRESVVNAERAERMLDPVIKEAAIENPQAIEYAERAIEADPTLPSRIIERLRSADPFNRSISLGDQAVLLIERTKLRKRRDEALVRASKKEGTPMERAIAEAEFAAVETEINAMDQAAQDSRSTWGRFGQFQLRAMREDFSLANLERRARMAKGDALTEKDLSKISEIAEKAKAAQDAIEQRTKAVAAQNTEAAIDAKIAEVSKTAEPPLSPAIRSLVDRVIARLDSAAANAEKSLRSRLANLGSAPDPLIVLDVAKMAAARTAKATIEFGAWAAEMVSKFGEKVRPFLQPGWDQKDQFTDQIIGSTAAAKKKEVAAGLKSKAPVNMAAQQSRIEVAIANRIQEGKPISSLAAYVNKLQELFIRQGINKRDALIDAVQNTLQKFDSTITRDATMEVMSKYGEAYATPLSKDPAKLTRRQIDGEIQQLLKLRDLAAKVPLPKSGPERPAPGPEWRALIKKVNEAKKKLGVVVTDPERQLRSSQDAIRARLRNQIEDMTLELETGEKPAGKSEVEYTQDMETLRAMRDRVRETLRAIDETPGITDEQRLALAKRSAEASLAMWERRLAGEQKAQPKGKVSSPEIDAIRAKRDALKAEVEEIEAADAVLQENRRAEALVNQIRNTEQLLTENATHARAEGPDSQLVAEARAQLRALQDQLSAQRAADPERQLAAIQKSEAALEASINKLSRDIEAGDIAPKTRKPAVTSERLDYLRAQRDALLRLRTQLRNEARPRLSADQLAIKAATARALARVEELQRRIATGDFGPRTRKPPVDISGDQAALDARAELMRVDAEFRKLQEQWKIDQMTWTQKRLRNIGQAWDAGSNLFLSFDLSTPIQTAMAMASRPVEGARAIGKGAKAFAQQFFKFSDAYAAREAARLANSPNAKNGVYKAMKLELPNAVGKAREENMGSVLENLADLDARWAGIPDVIKGAMGMDGRTLIRGAKRLGSVIPKVLGSGIKASNAAFETIANTMRARTADKMLQRWYGRYGVAPTKQQLELLGEQINVATGKGGLKAGDSLRRLLFAPNYYLSIIKQLTGYQLGKAIAAHEGKVAREIAEEYVRAALTMGGIYGLAMLFGDKEQMTFDPRDKNFGRAMTESGTALDITMGRGSWISTAAQIATGERIKDNQVVEQDRKGAFLSFLGGRLNRGVSTALTTAFGEDYRGKEVEMGDIARDFVSPLAWRDLDKVLEKEGLTRGSFIQLLNILGITHNIHE